MHRRCTCADADADAEFPLIDGKQLMEGIDQGQSEIADRIEPSRMFVHHRELIAAESGNEALAVGDLLDPVRDAHQHAVAEHVAQTVVVVLEIVDVDEPRRCRRCLRLG